MRDKLLPGVQKIVTKQTNSFDLLLDFYIEKVSKKGGEKHEKVSKKGGKHEKESKKEKKHEKASKRERV